MVAYSFAPQFREAVATLAKRQTVRAHRKRHARPGEPVQLFTGMRTKHCCKLIDVDPICTRVRPIEIMVVGELASSIQWIKLDGKMLSSHQIEKFARADGFAGGRCILARHNMGLFWGQRHGAGLFSGVVIEWAPHQ